MTDHLSILRDLLADGGDTEAVAAIDAMSPPMLPAETSDGFLARAVELFTEWMGYGSIGQECRLSTEAWLEEVAAARATAAQERLPFPTDGICPGCGSDHAWQVQEAGYMRFTDAQMDPGSPASNDFDHLAPFLAAFPNGSSDFTESGDEAWIVCTTEGCEGVYAVPDHLVFG